jgi:hypothetical protein
MKSWVDQYVPEAHREKVMSVLNCVPAVPQMQETKRGDNGEVSVSGSLTESALARSINITLTSLTLVTYVSSMAQDMLALKPDELTTWSPAPRIWTLITSSFFSENLIYLAINLLIINYLITQLNSVWSSW